MEKNVYIVVGNVSFLEEKNFSDNFLDCTDDELKLFLGENYDRADTDLAMYPLDEFIDELNNVCIDVDNSFFRKIYK